MFFAKRLSRFAPVKKIKRQRIRRDELLQLTPMVNQLLASVDIAEHADPAFSTDLAFKLYRRTRVDVQRLKTSDTTNYARRAFDRFINDIRSGCDTLSGPEARHILAIANDFIGDTSPVGHDTLDVGSHFRMSSSLAAKGRMLYTAARCLRAGRLLEIGTAYGMSAQFLLLAAMRYTEHSHLTTVELGQPQFTLAKQSLERSFAQRVECWHGESSTVLSALVAEEKYAPFDLVFYDGAHDGATYRADFERLKPLLRSGSVVIIDDIRWFDPRFVSEDPDCYSGWRAIVDDEWVIDAVELDERIGVALIG